jgi:hypothetical protein
MNNGALYGATLTPFEVLTGAPVSDSRFAQRVRIVQSPEHGFFAPQTRELCMPLSPRHSDVVSFSAVPGILNGPYRILAAFAPGTSFQIFTGSSWTSGIEVDGAPTIVGGAIIFARHSLLRPTAPGKSTSS